MPCKVSAEEISSSVPVLKQGEEEVAACADVKKAKEACLAEGGDCTELVKSFLECMEGAK